MGYRVIVHTGVVIAPKWYDFPRRLGWRPLKRVGMFDDGKVLIDHNQHIVYCTPAMEHQIRDAMLPLSERPFP